MSHVIIIGQTNKEVRRGGIPSYLYELEDYLSQSSVDYTLLEIGDKSLEKKNTISYASLEDNFFVRAYKLRKRILEINSAHSSVFYAINYWRELIFSIDIILRSKFVLHFHGPAYLEAKLEKKSKLHVMLARWYELLLYSKATSVICLSEHYKQLLVDKYNIDKDIINVIPYGFNSRDRFVAEENRNETLNILCVRRLVKRVGVDRLIEACLMLKNNNYRFKLTIVGTGVLLEHFKRVVKDYNLSDEVHLVGRLNDEDLTDLFKISDVSVIPTIGLEGFGIATVESLFHGVPVIGTEIGGTTEILAPLSADLLIDKPTPEKIYQKIVKIINKEIILPTRKACQEYAVARYDINNVAPKVVRVYHDIAQNN